MPLIKEMWVVHPDPETCKTFESRFAEVPKSRIVCSDYESLPPHDCFVTAGNSFGMMTAGIDAAVIRKFGPGLMDAVQARIMADHLGEQPIGTAFIVETGDDDFPFLGHAPTMRIPAGIDGTDKVYAATWAALLAVAAHNQRADRKIDTVVFPAMGTGYGGVDDSEAARQMAVAFEHYLDPPWALNWDTATERHRRICWDGDERVVHN